MVRPPLRQPATSALHLHLKPAIVQSLYEFLILFGCPDSQNSFFPQTRMRNGYSTAVVESRVVRVGQRRRAVVHIEQHRIESADARAERRADISRLDPHPLILQRFLRQRPERPAI